MTFTFKLVYGDEMLETLNNVDFNSFVVQETKDDTVTYYVRLPRSGDYYLIIFAHYADDSGLSKDESVFKAVCEYKIVGGDNIASGDGEPAPFPRCSDANWGPDEFISQYGLNAWHHSAIVEAREGSAEVGFDKSRDIKLYAQLVKDGVDNLALKSAVSVRKDDNEVFIISQSLACCIQNSAAGVKFSDILSITWLKFSTYLFMLMVLFPSFKGDILCESA